MFRTLTQTGEMVISLPIELRPVLLLREFGDAIGQIAGVTDIL
jgi:hypothetical protein